MFRAPDYVYGEAPKPAVKLTCGFSSGLEDKYERSSQSLGKGGFGSVTVVKSRSTGVEYACKSIAKLLDIPNVSAIKQEQHLNNIRREVSVLRKLRGTLNVVHLEEVYEDDTHVHIVMELCHGGELLQRIGSKHYSERTVASYMRAVLRTLAQCHHHRILHRDIKPGNFMLLTDAEDAPVKAIDFGLAVFFEPKKLPMRDLGLEGTPHYMAPEVLSSEVYPASDVWAAGVMAYQLLSGRFPFDDWKNLKSPALSQLWKSILSEEPKFSGTAWEGVSDGAKDFIRQLLLKDHKARPTAKDALNHPWIQGKSKQRTEGKPLAATIVQRLQRFGTQNAFKRTVLDMIANELLMKHLQNMATKTNITKKPLTATTTTPSQQQPPQPPPQAADAAAQGAPPDLNAGNAAVVDPSRPSAILPVAPINTVSASPGKAASRMYVPDASHPQMRSLAACSLIKTLHDKSATVHAGGQVGMLLRPSQGRFSEDRPKSPYLGQSPGMPKRASSSLELTKSHTSGDVGQAAAGTPLASTDEHEVVETVEGGQLSQQAELAGQESSAQLRSGPVGQPDPGKMFRTTSAATQAGMAAGAGAGSGRPLRRGQLGEGSGHALQHYAFLLAAGERSLHGLSTWQAMKRSASHAGGLGQHVGAGGAPGSQPPPHRAGSPISEHISMDQPSPSRDNSFTGGSPAVGLGGQGTPRLGSTPGHHFPAPVPPNWRGMHASHRMISGSPGMHHMAHVPHTPVGSLGSNQYLAPQLSLGAASRNASQDQVGGASNSSLPSVGLPSVDGMQRLLDAVQRQRQEHRKLQRLMLDTSGHAQSMYAYTTKAQKARDSGQPAGGPMSTSTTSSSDDSESSSEEEQEGVQLPEGQGQGKHKRKKSLMHKVSEVGRAILKPVKELLSLERAGSGSNNSSMHSTKRAAGGSKSGLASTDHSKHEPEPGVDASKGNAEVEGGAEVGKPSTKVRTSALTEALAATSQTAAQQPVSLYEAAVNAGPVSPAVSPFSELAKVQGVGSPEAVASGPSGAGKSLQDMLTAAAGSKGEAGAGKGSVVLGMPVPTPVKSLPGDGREEGLEAGGRAQGAYAALLFTQQAGVDAPAGPVGEEPGPCLDTAGAPQPLLHRTSNPVPGAETKTDMLSIHTVKAHKPTAAAAQAAASDGVPATTLADEHTIAAQLARIEQQQGPGFVSSGADATNQSRIGGTISKGLLYSVLGNLLGGQAQLEEFQEVMSKLRYDTQSELSFEEVTEGLKALGYRLEPSEVEVLLHEVALGSEHISQGAFLASQVDWRDFQANHRDEWLACLRTAFDGLARDTDGRIGEHQILNLLSSKLPAEEVNLAVQETLLDAAVLGAEGMDFDDFARLLRADSDSDLLSVGSYGAGSPPAMGLGGVQDADKGLRRAPSFDLYDARMDGSLHGPAAAVRGASQEGAAALPQPATGMIGMHLPGSWIADHLEHGSAAHGYGPYHPALETVLDEDKEEVD